MIVGLDTSVVVRLLWGQPADQARVAFDRVAELLAAGTRVQISDLVISETYYALQHHYGSSKTDVLDSLRDFLANSGVEASGVAAEVLTTAGLATAKPGFVDRLIERGYRATAAERMLTFERAAARLAGVEVLPS